MLHRALGAGIGVGVLSAAALGQGCPPGVYQYGPATWDLMIEQIVVDHYAWVGGPLTPTVEDYERAERDVGLILGPGGGVPGHVGEWEHRVILVQTGSPTSFPELTCTNAHFQASMRSMGVPLWWIVEFPRGVNQLAMAALYEALPDVTTATVNLYGSTSCAGVDAWYYTVYPDGTWRWSIVNYYGCGPGIGMCCMAVVTVEISASGVVCLVPDCNNDGQLTVADFACFQARFAQGNMWADCNRDGQLTVADFGCYQARFVTGCE